MVSKVDDLMGEELYVVCYELAKNMTTHDFTELLFDLAEHYENRFSGGNTNSVIANLYEKLEHQAIDMIKNHEEKMI